jgi:hypothetical protein
MRQLPAIMFVGGSCQVGPRPSAEPTGQGFPAPATGAGNATTRPLGCAGSGPP